MIAARSHADRKAEQKQPSSVSEQQRQDRLHRDTDSTKHTWFKQDKSLQKVEARDCIKVGILQKRGGRICDAWNDRFVSLSHSHISYAYCTASSCEQGDTIDLIPVWEIEDVMAVQEAHEAGRISDATYRRMSGEVIPGASEMYPKHADTDIKQVAVCKPYENAACAESSFVIFRKAKNAAELQRSPNKAAGAQKSGGETVPLNDRSDEMESKRAKDQKLIVVPNDQNSDPFQQMQRDITKRKDPENADVTTIGTAEGATQAIDERKYYFRATSREEMRRWILEILKARDEYTPQKMSCFVMSRVAVKNFIDSTPFQIFAAFAIVLNFLCNAVDAEILPEDGTHEKHVLDVFDTVFVWLFAAELALNMFANLFKRFLSDLWNYFDTFVVVIALVSTFSEDNNEGLNVLRMVRAFRVFRLFRRLKSLGMILRAIMKSIPAVSNAFALVAGVTSIYAIMGATIFVSQRPSEFGAFSIAMYTMWTIMTFDDAGILTNEMIAQQDGSFNRVAVALFTISFQLFVGFVLTNIVMAVLLEKFTEDAEESKAKGARQRDIDGEFSELIGPLDPVFSQFSRCETDVQFNLALEELFDLMDDDHSGIIDYHEFQDGLRRMDTELPVTFTTEDWNTLIVSRGLVMTNGMLDLQSFKNLFNVHFQEYVHRKIAKAADETRLDLKIQGILLSIQHTANKTLSTYKRMRKIQTDFGTMLANIQRMRSQVKSIKQKPGKRHLARSPVLPELGKDESHGTPYEDTNAVTVAQGNSPPPVKVALDTGSSSRAMHTNETSDTVQRLGTGMPIISAMTSPMSVSPHIKTPHIRTPLSLLANTPAALTKMDKIDPLISTSDALDMKDLHSRVYFLQSRITSTLQQTKVAREKTRTILLLRRAEELTSQNDTAVSSTTSRPLATTPSSLLDSPVRNVAAGTWDLGTSLNTPQHSTPEDTSDECSNIPGSRSWK